MVQNKSKKTFTLIPISLILLGIAFLYVYGIHKGMNFQTIQAEHAKWKSYAHLHPELAGVYFMAIYILSVILVIPDSTILTLIGGLLFPLPLAILYSSAAETIGAVIFFWATRFASPRTLSQTKYPKLFALQKNVLKNQVNYLLFARFSHLMPFWLINICAGLLRVRATTFLWTTWIGVLPLTILFSQAGGGLSKYLQTHTHFKIHEVFTFQLKILLIAIGCLALIPVIFKNWRKK